MFHARHCIIAGLALLIAAVALADPPADERLWEECVALQNEHTPGVRPEAVAIREALVQKARMYQTLYPGGGRMTDALRVELEALFELGCAAGGEFSRLERRVGELENARQPVAEAEVAYWELRIAELRLDSPVAEVKQRLRLDYVERFPGGGRTLCVLKELIDAASRAGDTQLATRLTDRLIADYGAHPLALSIAARRRLQEAVGRAFAFEPPPALNACAPEARLDGPMLLVVWISDAECREALTAIERRCAGTSVRAVGVNVDLDVSSAGRTIADLGLKWPMFRDPRGLTGAFARRWGIERTPFLLWTDRENKLAGFADGSAWREALESAAATASE